MKNFHRGSEDNKNYSIEISTKLKKYEINCPIFYIKCSTIYIRIYITSFALKLRNVKFTNSFESIKIGIYEESIDKQISGIYSSTTRMFPPIIHR